MPIEGGGGDGEPPDLGEYLRRTYSQTIKKITAMEKPIVAALHGPVYGAGVGVAAFFEKREPNFIGR